MGFRVAWYSYYTQAQKSAINYQVGRTLYPLRLPPP